MALDASIPLQVRPLDIGDPLERAGKLARLQALQGSGQLQQLQLQEAQQGAADRRSLKDIGMNAVTTDADGNKSIDRKKLLTGLYGVDPLAASKVEGDYAESDSKAKKATAEARKSEIEGQLQTFEIISRVASGVTDQPSYDAGRKQLQDMRIDTSAMPAEFNPAAMKVNQMRALSMKDRLDQEYKKLTAGETARHNRAMESKQGADNNKPPAGYRWAADGSLEAIQGGPADKKEGQRNAVPTEGERKAATLYSRLKFSEQQLQDALQGAPNAANPSLVSEGARAVAGDTAANALTGQARQRVEAAQLDLLDAALTLGTGAAYTKEQLRGYARSYFPQIGDDDKTVADKQARLQNVIGAARISAGRAAEDADAMPGPVNRDAAPAAGKYAVGQIIEQGGKKYRVTGGDPNDPDVEEVQ